MVLVNVRCACVGVGECIFAFFSRKMDGNVSNSISKPSVDVMDVDLLFKRPLGVPKRRRSGQVLDEESYIEEMGKIIQRDFFPDLERLKAQKDYLEAQERNDMTRMREIYMKYSGRRPTPQRIPSPATFETPVNIHNSQHIPEPPTDAPESPDTTPRTRISLDQFLSAHTSQDNDSFEAMMIEAEARHRTKYAYLYNEEEKCEAERQRALALPSVAQQCALPAKPLNIDTWSYKNRNYIMYIPDGVAPTDAERIEMARNRQEVAHANTRLVDNPFNEHQSQETISELAKTQAKVLDGKIGVDGKELNGSEVPGLNGYSFMRTPSPRPGIADSPLMTWGEIEGTPFRLDGSDTPLRRSTGPSFKMSAPPRREQLALALAEKVGEKHRGEKKKQMDAARRSFVSPSPRPSTSAIDRLATMSPAARKLAATRLRIGSPLEMGARTPTPATAPHTPRSRTATPKLTLGIRKVGGADDLTDDLLNLSLPKRQKASDFF